ncbi:MAG: MFS transporter [Bacteroidetes bacterium]|nr:MFS transporter [Bacteroidota bacterium]
MNFLKNLNTFRAFQSRNYRLYFAGQSISLIGTWMQRTAVYWVIFSQTHSTFMLGLTAFATQFPSFALSLWGGVVSDRYNRYKVLLTTQIASLIQAVLLTVLIIVDPSSVWLILVISVVLGIINAFDVPARQSLVYEMIERKQDLPNALALNSSMVNLARLLGPAVAGIVLEKFGESFCFGINAFSFVAVIVSLLMMRLPKYVAKEHPKKISRDLNEGFKYLKQTPSIAIVILMLAFMSLLVLPFTTLLPVYAKVIFAGSASTFGFLNSFIGLGAISGAIYLASQKSGSNLKKILITNTVIFGAGLIIFSHMTNLPLALLFAAITGFGMMSQTTISNTLIQTRVAPEMRGRVLSYFVMAFFGMQPIGALIVGSVSQYIGTPNTILAEGIAALVILFFFLPYLRKDKIRREEEKVLENKTVEINSTPEELVIEEQIIEGQKRKMAAV